MKQWKRLLFYLLLNVLVSACTTLGVLFAWDQIQGPLPRDLLPKALLFSRQATPTPALDASGTPVPRPTATEYFIAYQVQPGDTFDSIAAQHNISVEELIAVNGFSTEVPLGAGEVLQIPAHPKGSVVIDGVIGVGDLQTERVLLKHRGEGELSMDGWRLQDGDGNEYVFPQALILYKGGAVNVYTKAGVNTVVDLFWGLPQPVWKSGETVTLRDGQGNSQAQFTVP